MSTGAIATGAGIVEMTMSHLLPAKFDGQQARVALLAFAMQESGFVTRLQQGGPARGYWQAEQGGSIRAVLGNRTTASYAKTICLLRGVAPVESDVYAALLSDDLLACGFARLDMWADPSPLPMLGDAAGCWNFYIRVENPGRPRPLDWPANYAAALAAVTSTTTTGQSA
jgi:hypothetical protein